MIRIFDKTSRLFRIMGINNHKYISNITTENINTNEYEYHKDKKEMYNILGFDNESIPKHNISIYYVYGASSHHTAHHDLCNYVIPLLVNIGKIDIVINWASNRFPFKFKEKYEQYEITTIYGDNYDTDSEIYINGMKISATGNTDSKLKYVVRKCINEIVNESKVDLKALIFEQQKQIDALKQLVIEQNANALSVTSTSEENEELKSTIADLKNQLEEYKKSILVAKDLFGNLNI